VSREINVAVRSAARLGKMTCWKAASLITAVVLVISAGSAPAAESPRVAFFGFFLINTSLQPTQPAEEKRLEMLDTILGGSTCWWPVRLGCHSPEGAKAGCRWFWNSELQRT
jgi:hypothetical protein